MKKVSSIALALFFYSNSLWAESGAVDFLRSTGKIYSVVAVISVLFIGLFIYLWRLDKKISKIENHLKDE